MNLTAESTPRTAPESCRKACSKCKGRAVGDFGIHVKAGRCYSCDGGFTFTAKAFAEVLVLRNMKLVERIEAEGAAIKAGAPVRGCWTPETKLADLRRSYVEAKARANAAWKVARQPNVTLAAVRIAVYGENDTDIYAK